MSCAVFYFHQNNAVQWKGISPIDLLFSLLYFSPWGKVIPPAIRVDKREPGEKSEEKIVGKMKNFQYRFRLKFFLLFLFKITIFRSTINKIHGNIFSPGWQVFNEYYSFSNVLGNFVCIERWGEGGDFPEHQLKSNLS